MRERTERKAAISTERIRESALRGLTAAAALIAAVGPAACGNLTAGGASEVEVVVASDESESESSTSPSWSQAESGSAGLLAGSDLLSLEGTLQADLSVRLADAEGNEIELTGGIQEILISLTPGSRTTATSTTVPAGDYQLVSARIHRVGVEVVAGPGVSVPIEFELDFTDGPHEVAVTGDLTFATDERVRVVLDFQVGRWVLTPAAERSARFRSAVTLAVESAD